MVSPEEQVSWNLSQVLSNKIGSLISSASSNSLNGKEMNSFFCYREISILIYHHLSEKEREKIFDREKEINSVVAELNKLIRQFKREDIEASENESLKEQINRANTKRYFHIQEYKKLILNLLDTYGYLMERKKDSSRMF